MHPVQFAWVFIAMMVYAVMETVSLSLLIPVMSLILEEQPLPIAAKYLDPLYGLFPHQKPLHILLVLMVVLTVAKSIIELLKAYGTSHLSWKLYEYWTNTILQKYLYSPFSYIIAQRQGTLVTNLNEPGPAAKTMIAFFELLTTLIVVTFLYASLWLVHWRGTLILTALTAVLGLTFRGKFFGDSSSAGRERLTLTQRIGAYAAENVLALRLIRAYGLENLLLERFRKATRGVYQVSIKFETLRAATKPAIESAMVLGIAVFIAIVDFRTGGDFKPILPTLAFVLLAVKRLLSYAPLLLSQIMGIQFSLSSLSLVDELSRIPTQENEKREGIPFARLEQDLIFEDIDFNYSADRPVLRAFNLRVPKGKMTAIIGPSGVGKSTVADLLLSLITPAKGRILVNGLPLTDYNLDTWRAKIGYVSQDTILLSGSIAENIRLGRPEANDEEIVEAAKQAALHEFIVGLPKGYKTKVGDRGMMLSGGQRQRIAIARALVRKPELFIFDEATSALDQETEKSIQTSIEGLARGKTVVVIAHRLSTIEKADMVYDFKTRAVTNV
jgi:subfamily B ATP-binding cassette protein MsbA